MSDKNQTSAIGVNARSESVKALHRSLFFATLLVFAHLLDITPTEIDAVGIKVAVRDVAIIYGALALVYGYYLSRAASLSDVGFALTPLMTRPYILRAAIRATKRSAMSDKASRQDNSKRTPQKIKKSAKTLLRASNAILFPYRLTASIMCFLAGIFAAYDIYQLFVFMLTHSTLIKLILKDFN